MDIRDEPDRALSLARENGKEIQLDFQTGRLVECPARTSEPVGPGPLMQAVLGVLENRNWKRYLVQTPERVVLPLNRDRFRFHLCLLTDENCRVVLCWVVLPIRVPPERRAEVGELLHRANSCLPESNFELDYWDGEVRIKAVILLGTSALGADLLNETINVALGTAEQYHDAILKVGFGALSAENALGEIEGGD
jgi:hypothetical protein